MRNWHRRISLNNKMTLQFLLLLAANLLAIMLYGRFWDHIMYADQKSLAENTLQVYHNSLDRLFYVMNRDLTSVLLHETQLERLSTSNDVERAKTWQQILALLKDKCDLSENIDAYAVINREDGNILIQRNGNISYDDILTLKEYMLQRIDAATEDGNGWYYLQLESGAVLTKCYVYRDTCVASFLTEERIASLLDYNNEDIENAEFYLTDAQGRVICGSGSDWTYGDPLADPERASRFAYRYEGNMLQGTYRIYEEIHTMIGGKELTSSGGMIWITLLCSVFIFIWISRYTKREILMPIQSLTNVCRSVSEGDLGSRADYACRNPEMEDVKDTFNTMLQTIVDMRIEQYEREIEIRDVQLKYMHMQLRPHYFLNALSTINSMAYQHQDEEIHEFIQAFSQNIRYMFRVGIHTLPLAEEAQSIEGYLEMQRLMYRDCFYVYMDVPEALGSYPVPQMILHVFMENVFKHVISVDTFTTVLVQASLADHDGENMLQLVIDTSQGQFPQEVIDRMAAGLDGEAQEQSIQTSRGQGVGLRNIREVMRILYGREHLIRLENQEPDGTRITVWIPERTRQMDTQEGRA